MNSYWRNTGATVKFLMVDWKASILLLLLIFFTSVKMLIICTSGILILAILEYYGYTIPNALRKLRVILFGKYKRSVTKDRMGRIDR